jgi:hypothetical protein
LDHRLKYVVGDFLAALVIGTVSGVIAWAIVSPAWNMWLAMFSMMALGMVIGLVMFFPLAAKLGAMEAMIPAMYTGMWAGMFVGMLGSMMEVPILHAAEIGAACGVAEIILIWIINTILRGVSREGKEVADA